MVVPAVAMALSACSVVNLSSTTYYRDGEGRFSQQIIESIKPKATSHIWLKQQFGQPMWVDQAAHNVAICTWQFVREQHKRKDLILLVRYRTISEETEYLHVVLQDGVVVQYWQDRHQIVDVERVIYALGLELAPKPEPHVGQHMAPQQPHETAAVMEPSALSSLEPMAVNADTDGSDFTPKPKAIADSSLASTPTSAETAPEQMLESEQKMGLVAPAPPSNITHPSSKPQKSDSLYQL